MSLSKFHSLHYDYNINLARKKFSRFIDAYNDEAVYGQGGEGVDRYGCVWVNVWKTFYSMYYYYILYHTSSQLPEFVRHGT